mmetsp:Transcript_725/g.2807  ORF Transcript_725/g.2807 Transcript_725/m.2807 type:complete len:236 (+) Transcript_725:2227-2934(+)
MAGVCGVVRGSSANAAAFIVAAGLCLDCFAWSFGAVGGFPGLSGADSSDCTSSAWPSRIASRAGSDLQSSHPFPPSELAMTSSAAPADVTGRATRFPSSLAPARLPWSSHPADLMPSLHRFAASLSTMSTHSPSMWGADSEVSPASSPLAAAARSPPRVAGASSSSPKTAIKRSMSLSAREELAACLSLAMDTRRLSASSVTSLSPHDTTGTSMRIEHRTARMNLLSLAVMPLSR